MRIDDTMTPALADYAQHDRHGFDIGLGRGYGAFFSLGSNRRRYMVVAVSKCSNDTHGVSYGSENKTKFVDYDLAPLTPNNGGTNGPLYLGM